MKNEITRRVIRIIFVLIILLLGTFIRTDVKESYKINESLINSLTNNLQLTKLNENTIAKNNKVTSSYYLEVHNPSKKEKTFTFEVNSEEHQDAIDFKYVKYQVIKDNKIIKEGYLSDNKIIYQGIQEENTKDIYEIKFLINKTEIKGKKFLAKIALI